MKKECAKHLVFADDIVAHAVKSVYAENVVQWNIAENDMNFLRIQIWGWGVACVLYA